MKAITITLLLPILLVFVLTGQSAHADRNRIEVTVTNITGNIFLTPPIIAVSKREIPFVQVGSPPSDELADLAEGGATDGLAAIFEANSAVVIQDTAPLRAGESRTYVFDERGTKFVSFATMLLPTNDGFVAFSTKTKDLPKGGAGFAAYDAGSEKNTEMCADIPGPQCMGSPFSPGLYEGYVHPHAGIHGEAELSVEQYDWRDPVIWVQVSSKK
jgi:hypothetical protein